MSQTPDFGSRREFYSFAPEDLAQSLPGFQIVREVGKGSMGIVYEARRKADGERVALKVLPPSLTLTERALARFLREGRIMARIRHPDIVGFHDQGQSGRLHWFEMEFVDGVTLQERLAIGPLPVQKACAICAHVGRALQFAHEHGVVHRDIKPGNIMLRAQGDEAAGAAVRVAITDFGLARETGTGSMTESGAIVGTPMYMAPEQVLGGSAHADTLGDIYGLGATLYTLVTGVPPFEGPTAQSVLKSVLEREPVRPRRLRADLPDGVEAIVLKAMQKEPRARYGSAQELAEDLERFLRGERVLARRPNALQRAVGFCKKRPLLAALAFAVLVLGTWALLAVRERDRQGLLARLSDAERFLALASTQKDELDRPRTADERHELLLSSVAAASEVIRAQSDFELAWLVRAKAHHKLRQYGEAIFDLDTAERLHGEPTPDLLEFRIDALRQQGDRASVLRLQRDLKTLLELAPEDHTRALVAEHLVAIAERATGAARKQALVTASEVLAPVGVDDAHAGVARARVLELGGDRDGAVAAAKALRTRHAGDAFVHLQLASLFDRLGLPADGKAEREKAGMLQPTGGQPEVPPMDIEGVGGFLGDVTQLLQELEKQPPAGKIERVEKAEKQ